MQGLEPKISWLVNKFILNYFDSREKQIDDSIFILVPMHCLLQNFNSLKALQIKCNETETYCAFGH